MRSNRLSSIALGLALAGGPALALTPSTFQKYSCVKDESFSGGLLSFFELSREANGKTFQASAKLISSPRGLLRTVTEERVLAMGLSCANDEHDQRIVQCSSKEDAHFETSARNDDEVYPNRQVIVTKLTSREVDGMTEHDAARIGLRYDQGAPRKAVWQMYLYRQPKPRPRQRVQTDTCTIR